MAGNVLWTSIFNQPTSQASELTRHRIIQEERCGRRPATTTPGPVYEDIVRGRPAPGYDKLVRDPWQPEGPRTSVQPPIVGYGGTVPRVRPEHTGVNNGEQAAHFVPHFDTEPFFAMKRTAPAGGASALGTKPVEVPGTRSEFSPSLFICLLALAVLSPLLLTTFSRLCVRARSARWPRHLRLAACRAGGGSAELGRR